MIRTIRSGPRARNMKAWVGASTASGGPGNRGYKFFRGLKGRNKTPPFSVPTDLPGHIRSAPITPTNLRNK